VIMSRRLAAILAADVVGYSRLMGADELARWRERFPWGNAEYSALFDETVAVGLRRAGFPETSAPPNWTTGP